MSEQMESLDNIVTLTDDEGNEVPFEFLDLVEYEGEGYVVLLPCDDEDGEVVILKIEEGDGEGKEAFVSIEDDNILNTVFNIFKDKYQDEFDFAD